MRVLIDVLGSPRKSGGMRLHAEEIVRSWCELYPADELVVLGPSWTSESFADLDVVILKWPNDRVLARAAGQLLIQPIAAVAKNVDVVVSLSPIVSPFVVGRPKFCFEHDWRHVKNKNEFGLGQRAYRQLWEISASKATGCLCISDKAEQETLQLVPSAETEVIPNGGDHARRWQLGDKLTASVPSVVTFGHHNNKRPDLVIRALQQVSAEVDLTVLGAQGEFADSLRALAASLGKDQNVHFPGFVSESEYQRYVSGADCIVVASSDEGFGLAIPEALYFGIPVVVAEDSGVAEMHGPRVISAAPSPMGLGIAIGDALARGLGEPGEVPRWLESVQKLRKRLANSL